MSTPHVLLALLAQRPRHGYELKHAYDQRLPQARPLAFAQVYSTLSRLQRDGLVQPTGTDQAGGPERTAYAITDSGRDRLDQWLAETEAPMPHVASALLSKVVVALLVADPSRAEAYLTAQRAAHTARVRELTRLKTTPDITVGDLIAADYALAHLTADLTWLSDTLHRVGALAEEVTA